MPPITAASPTALTVIATLAEAELAPSLSMATKLKDVLPFQLAFGAKLSEADPAVAGITWPSVTATPPNNSLPLAGRLPIVKLAMEPSTSEPPRLTGMASSSLPDAGMTAAVGASLAPLTVTVTMVEVPSAAVTVKLSTGCWALVSACTAGLALFSV